MTGKKKRPTGRELEAIEDHLIEEESDDPGGTTMATTPATGTPIIIQHPVVHIMPEGGTDDIDVSCDIGSIELSPDQAITEVVRFCGTVQVPGLMTETCTVGFVVNDTTAATWAAFLGKKVTVKVWTSSADTKGKTFDSYIGFNPGLYGGYTPGEAVEFSSDLPVMSAVAEGAAAPVSA